MIPANTITPTPIEYPFAYLEGQHYDPLYQRVMGGIALNDPSLGRLVQPWSVAYVGTSIEIRPADGTLAFSMTELGVLAVSLAFDNNMAPAIAWMTTAGANLYYYDTVTAGYITRFFTEVLSCRVAVDDPREFYTTMSDVIFGYTLGTNLYWRQQRDRYDIQRTVGPTTQLLMRMGPSVGNRLQFQCV